MNKVLILGVCGFTGRHFQDYILNNHLDRNFSFIGADRIIEKRIGIEYREIDLLEGENIEKLVREARPDYIMNFSGIFNSSYYSNILEANAGLSFRIFDTVAKHDMTVKNILLVGSAAEYGMNSSLPLKEDSHLCPVSLYGLSKVIQTQYALYYHQNFKINVNVARTFNIIGDGMSTMLSISSFLKQIREAVDGSTIYVGNLNTKRDYLDISDVVDAYWKILNVGGCGRIYNVCRGKSDLIQDILDYMIKKSGKKIHVVVKDDYVKKNDILDSYGDNTRIVKDTGWSCQTDLYKAIDKMFQD